MPIPLQQPCRIYKRLNIRYLYRMESASRRIFVSRRHDDLSGRADGGGAARNDPPRCLEVGVRHQGRRNCARVTRNGNSRSACPSSFVLSPAAPGAAAIPLWTALAELRSQPTLVQPWRRPVRESVGQMNVVVTGLRGSGPVPPCRNPGLDQPAMSQGMKVSASPWMRTEDPGWPWRAVQVSRGNGTMNPGR